ncbi:MAG: hypothetical protein AB7N65_00935 [Vicinamibacterales bacterium]
MTIPMDHGAVRVTLPSGQRRIYHVDPEHHRVVVTDAGTGAILFAFGRRGSTLGAFDVPVDIALVAPSFQEETAAHGVEEYCLAVADYGNARVQLFDLDGTLIDVLTGTDLDYGWRPCRLTWRAPFLQVDGVERTGCRVHLAAAMLAHAGGHLAGSAALERSRGLGEARH